MRSPAVLVIGEVVRLAPGAEDRLRGLAGLTGAAGTAGLVGMVGMVGTA